MNLAKENLHMCTSRLESTTFFPSLNDQPGPNLINDEAWQGVKQLVGMNLREYQVCRLIFEGRTRAQAASELGISTRTVRHYLELLHTKLKVSSRVSLVLRLVQIRDWLAQNESLAPKKVSI